jgi:hypothetical protein
MSNEQNPSADLGRVERPRLIDEAASIVGYDLGKRPEFASAANVSGVRTKTYTYSRRLDSRTIFARDERYGLGDPAGTWTGAKRPLVSSCRRVLRAAGIRASEIDKVDVVTELGQVAEYESSKASRPEKPTTLRRVAIARRSMDGAGVWSSYCSVALTADGGIGEVELHWPVIPDEVLDETRLLHEFVAPRFKPTPRTGAVVESVDAGVLHSPAIGFFMDTYAAIRVVYRASEGGPGRQTVSYVDRHGNPVDLPRDIKTTPADTGPRPEAKR